MTNFEYYKRDILKFTESDDDFGIKDGKLFQCAVLDCNECAFCDDYRSCDSARIKWLYKTHTNNAEVLTKLTQLYLVQAKRNGFNYVARDQNGTIALHKFEPIKRNKDEYGKWISGNNSKYYLDESFIKGLDFITWKENTPRDIKYLTDNCEVIE